MPTLRDRDIRADIQAKLDATGEFGESSLIPWDDSQGQRNAYRYATILPDYVMFSEPWGDQGGPVRWATAFLDIAITARDEDSRVRDELAERLAYVAVNAVEGESLAGLTVPIKTIFTRLKWEKPDSDARTITLTLTYMYEIGVSGSLGTAE